MKLNRNTLIRHFNRINADDEIGEVVLRPDLSTEALTPDQAFFVAAPALMEDAEILPRRLGIPDFTFLINVLSKFGAEEMELEVRDEVGGERIVMESEGLSGYVMTADPDTIGTRVEDEQAQAVIEEVSGSGYALPEKVGRQVLTARDLTGAMEIELQVSPQGSTFQVGAVTGQFMTVDFPQLQADEEYTLLLQANAVMAALNRVDDWDEAELVLTGPDSIVALHYEGYSYVLSPLG